MRLSPQDALARTLAFAERETPPPRPAALTATTDLRGDLRMIWEDAESFADKFFREFEVDPGDFAIRHYFPREGSLATALAGLLGRRSPPPARLTLGMFAQAAVDGVWRQDRAS